jgi:DNA modification methylase
MPTGAFVLKGPQRAEGPKLEIQYISIDALTPHSSNARLHGPRQLRRLTESIKSFGFNVPVLIDADGGVIAGHGRLQAAKRAGLCEVPTIRIEHLSEAQRKAFMIADNRLAEIATWDDKLLAEQLRALASVELNFDIETIGFDMGEIDLRIESLKEPSATPQDDEPALPEPAGLPVTHIGDLWRLGRHKVLCGDARDEAAYAALMGPERAAAVFADPPYNVEIDGHVCGLGELRHREFVMAAGELTPEEFTRFLADALAGMKAVSQPGAIAFVCMDWRHIGELIDAGRSLNLDLVNLCVWTKPNAGMGSLYRSQHELVFVLKLQHGRHRNNVQLGAIGRNRSNVWPYAVAPGFGRVGEEGRLAALHPTVKPTSMIADAILDVTRRGDIVLDPFLGSGATLMAAERTGRKAYGIELDPIYVDVIVRRWQAYTGEHARLGKTGETFDAVAERGLRSARQTPELAARPAEPAAQAADAEGAKDAVA